MEIRFYNDVTKKGGICPSCYIRICYKSGKISNNVLQSKDGLYCGICERKVAEVK